MLWKAQCSQLKLNGAALNSISLPPFALLLFLLLNCFRRRKEENYWCARAQEKNLKYISGYLNNLKIVCCLSLLLHKGRNGVGSSAVKTDKMLMSTKTMKAREPAKHVMREASALVKGWITPPLPSISGIQKFCY